MGLFDGLKNSGLQPVSPMDVYNAYWAGRQHEQQLATETQKYGQQELAGLYDVENEPVKSLKLRTETARDLIPPNVQRIKELAGTGGTDALAAQREADRQRLETNRGINFAPDTSSMNFEDIQKRVNGQPESVDDLIKGLSGKALEIYKQQEQAINPRKAQKNQLPAPKVQPKAKKDSGRSSASAYGDTMSDAVNPYQGLKILQPEELGFNNQPQGGGQAPPQEPVSLPAAPPASPTSSPSNPIDLGVEEVGARDPASELNMGSTHDLMQFARQTPISSLMGAPEEKILGQAMTLQAQQNQLAAKLGNVGANKQGDLQARIQKAMGDWQAKLAIAQTAEERKYIIGQISQISKLDATMARIGNPYNDPMHAPPVDHIREDVVKQMNQTQEDLNKGWNKYDPQFQKQIKGRYDAILATPYKDLQQQFWLMNKDVLLKQHAQPPGIHSATQTFSPGGSEYDIRLGAATPEKIRSLPKGYLDRVVQEMKSKGLGSDADLIIQKYKGKIP